MVYYCGYILYYGIQGDVFLGRRALAISLHHLGFQAAGLGIAAGIFLGS